MRVARERSGFILKAVAELTGISIQRINKYERNKCRPSFEDLQLLANVLRHNPAWLAFGTGPERLDEPGSATALTRLDNAMHLNASVAAHAAECSSTFYEIEKCVKGSSPLVEKLRSTCVILQMILKDQSGVLSALRGDLEKALEALNGRSPATGAKTGDV
jgi:transcriptional regulator with XRE-family HTH domain